jgi:AraC-like DNA-binding protein
MFLWHAIAIIFILISYSFNISQNYFPSDFIRCIIIFTIAAYSVKQNTLSRVQDNLHSITAPVLNEEIILVGMEADNHVIAKERKIEIPKEINGDLLSSIVEIVEKDEMYLNEELTIADLAKKLGYSTKTISYTINNGLQKSFSLFINEYRVNLFKKKKISGNFDHLSIMGLAYECGFNSKSSFNRIFKEVAGITPNEIKREIEEVPN